MNTPQVSVWVPIVVGVIGLVGIVTGQLVNAWREDRRWKREQEREDLRWRREIDRQNVDRRVADLSHWRDKKFEIYTELLEFMKSWRKFIYEAATSVHRGTLLSSENKATCEAFFHKSFEHRNDVDLIATDPQAQEALLEAIDVYANWTTPLTIDHSAIRSPNTHIDDLVDSNEEVIDIVTTAIRADLGIARDDERDYLTRIKELKR